MAGRDQTVEEALHEKKAEFDRLVESEKTADSINDFFMETVKEAVRPLLARRPRNEEEWVWSEKDIKD